MWYWIFHRKQWSLRVREVSRVCVTGILEAEIVPLQRRILTRCVPLRPNRPQKLQRARRVQAEQPSRTLTRNSSEFRWENLDGREQRAISTDLWQLESMFESCVELIFSKDRRRFTEALKTSLLEEGRASDKVASGWPGWCSLAKRG